MNDIVFLFPEIGTGTHGIHTEAESVIDPLLSAVAAMVGIMHYTKTNAGHSVTQQSR